MSGTVAKRRQNNCSYFVEIEDSKQIFQNMIHLKMRYDIPPPIVTSKVKGLKSCLAAKNKSLFYYRRNQFDGSWLKEIMD